MLLHTATFADMHLTYVKNKIEWKLYVEKSMTDSNRSTLNMFW